jgi:signal transduction histidine kinase
MTSVRARSTVRCVHVDPRKLDFALAAALTVALELETWTSANANGHRLAVAAAGPLTTAALALRRRYPAAVGIGALLSSVVMQTAWPSAEVSYAVAWMCDVYALVAWTPVRTFVAGLAAYIAACLATIPLPGGDAKGTVQFLIPSTTVMLVVRWVLDGRERRLRLAERERDLAAREAVVEERARIARELHDAIAHNVSMMVVQAGAERRVVLADSTREVLGTIEQIGRGALTEMRRLVGMLRSDEADPLAPQPGLDDLPTLVGQVREAGLPVELRVEGERRGLPVGIELSAYRIVQEALTNALKHAGEARAAVHVRYGPDSLELEIVDDGAGVPAPVPSGGHGLVGIRERVALYGGRFDAGRNPGGGFAVRVLLPLR